MILQQGRLVAIGLIKQNPGQIRGIFHLTGGNRCGISAWRLTCCIYVQREGSIHHGAVMCCLRGLSGGQGNRRKISGPGLGLLAFSLPGSWVSAFRECHTVLWQGKDTLHPTLGIQRPRFQSPPCHSLAVCPWVSDGASLSLSFFICEMERIGVLKLDLAMIQNLG